VVAYKHLISAPVFECDRLWYLRVGDRKAVVLKHVDGSPVGGFGGSWMPVFVYTGLDGLYLLAFECDDLRATWLVSPDGRRLGDKLSDLQPDQRDRLREAVLARGLGRPDGLIGDGLQFIEPILLRDILGLVSGAEAASGPTRPHAAQRALAMQGAPRQLRTHLQFKPGDERLALQEGWVSDKAGFCRGTGTLSTARAPIVPPASRHLLTLTLLPAGSRQGEPPVELEIAVNDRILGHTRLDPKWQGDGAAVAFWLPPELVNGKPLEITFRHSQDFRLAALTLEQGQALPTHIPDAAELMLKFENIGDNCEFGLVQRHFGADPVGLLRFAGLRDPYRLIRFLEDDFGNFGEPGSLGVRIVGGEYWIIDHVYGIAYHTFRYQHEATAEDVICENEIKSGYLKRKFREDLEDGEKILVYKRVVTQDVHEMIALHAALNRRGSVNKLLWVTEADACHAPGEVEWVGDRLLKGYTGSISLTNAHHFEPEVWLRLCRNALAAFEAAESR
jgi:hypothetical protein